CWTVGQYDGGGGTYHNLVEHGVGDTWSIEPSPNTSDALSNGLNGVTCFDTGECWAVGYSYTGVSSDFQTLIEHRVNGTWSIVATPNPSTATESFLYGVACPTVNVCWAVGWDSNAVQQTVIEEYSGGVWSIVNSPNPVSESSFLYGVACQSPTSCWASGWFEGGTAGGALNGVGETLIEHYDGTAWSIVQSANPGSGSSGFQNNWLFGITCQTGGSCWSVGWYANNSPAQSLIETNASGTWAAVSAPNEPDPGTSDELASVACSSTSCYAVGDYYDKAAQDYKTIIEETDGNSWYLVPSENITDPASNTAFTAVACSALDACRAVGYDYASSACSGSFCVPYNRTLIEDNSAPASALPEAPLGPLAVAGMGIGVASLAMARRRRSSRQSAASSASSSEPA
ncbi:MAG: hypothetical protein ABR498_05550, partial [Candidatus Dormibacteria bacterium]